MQDRTSDESTDTPHPSFSEARDNIEKFFVSSTVRGLVNEFYETQNNFHRRMDLLVRASFDTCTRLPLEQQEIFEKVLKPYGVLVANPFNEKPSGNISADIVHIFGVINARNEHFQKSLPALMLASANLYQFNEILKTIHGDKQLSKNMMDGMQTSHWAEVESAAALPMQNLMRYTLLLSAIENELKKSGLEKTHTVLQNVMQIIAYISPELKYIDSNSDNMIQLNRIDNVIRRIIDMPNAETFVTEQDKKVELSFIQKAAAVRIYIGSIQMRIARGEADVLASLEGLLEMLKLLEVGTKAAMHAERNTYVSWLYRGALSWSDSIVGENVIFHKPPADPREELSKLIVDLTNTCEMINFIRKKQTGF